MVVISTASHQCKRCQLLWYAHHCVYLTRIINDDNPSRSVFVDIQALAPSCDLRILAMDILQRAWIAVFAMKVSGCLVNLC